MCEEVKKCTKCGRELPATNEFFYRDSRTKDGFVSRCKECRDTADKERRLRDHEKCKQRRKELYDPEKAKINSAIYRENHKEELKAKKKQYYEEHREEILEQKKKYHQENKEHRNEYNRKYAEENKERLKEYSRIRYEKERDKILEQHKLYYLKKREEILIQVAEYRKNNKNKIYESNKRYYQTLAGMESQRKASHRRKARERDLKATLTLEQWQACVDCFDNTCAYCGKEKKLTQDHFVPVVKQGTYTVDNILPACRSCNSSKQDFDFGEWYKTKPFYSEKRLRKIYKYLNYDGDCLQFCLDL